MEKSRVLGEGWIFFLSFSFSRASQKKTPLCASARAPCFCSVSFTTVRSQARPDVVEAHDITASDPRLLAASNDRPRYALLLAFESGRDESRGE